MSKRKKTKQKQSHMSAKAVARNHIMTSGMVHQPQLALPAKAKEFLQNLPDEVKKDWKPTSLLEVAQMAKVDKRVGLLLSAYYHIHTVQGLLVGEISNWLDGFNLWIKGVRPAMNDVERADDKFYAAMRTIIDPNKGGTHQEYLRDCDSLYEKVMHWEGIPKYWQIGDPLHTKRPSERPKEDGRLVVDDGHEEKVVGTVTLPPEVKETRNAYCISRLNDDETADIVKADIKNKGLAAAAANRMAKKEPGKMFIVYEQTIETQEVATIKPIKGTQMPVNGSTLVEFNIGIDLAKKDEPEEPQESEEPQPEQEGGQQ